MAAIYHYDDSYYFTDESIRMTYGLIVAFSFIVLTMAERYISRSKA